jgi:hypothetical protein
MAVVLIRVKRNENDLRQKTTWVPARGVHPSRHEKGVKTNRHKCPTNTNNIYRGLCHKVNKEFSATPIPSDGLDVREA